MIVSPELNPLLAPVKLWHRHEVLSRPCPVAAEPGVYAWYFDELPHPDLDPSGCHHFDGLPLLYTGISPERPPVSGAPASTQNLRKRVLGCASAREGAPGAHARRRTSCGHKPPGVQRAHALQEEAARLPSTPQAGSNRSLVLGLLVRAKLVLDRPSVRDPVQNVLAATLDPPPPPV